MTAPAPGGGAGGHGGGDKSFGKAAGKGLQEKIGPFPVWVYGGVIVGGVFLWRRHQNQKIGSSALPASATGDAADTAPSDETNYTSPSPENYNVGGGTAGSQPGSYYQQPPVASNTDVQDAKDDYIKKAVSYLISQGYNGTQADQAIRAYFDGTYTVAQQNLIDKVIANYGTADGAVAPSKPQGSGVTFNVSTQITTQINKLPQHPGDSLVVDVFWKDANNAPVTGTLTNQGLVAAVKGVPAHWQNFGYLSVKNGVGRSTTTAYTLGVHQSRWATTGNDLVHKAAASPVVTYTITAKPKGK